MRQEKQYLAAIDIGTSKIVGMIGQVNPDGQIEVVGLGNVLSRGVKRGVVLNIEETSQSIQKAMEAAERQAGVRVENVYVGIAGKHIKSMKNRGYRFIDNDRHEVTAQDVEALTQDMYKIPLEEGNEVIHVIPQNYMVDSELDIENPRGMSGKRLEGNFHIVIGKVAAANNVIRCVERAGYRVNRLILEPLASAEAVLNEDEKEAGVALVDIGGGTTDVAVFYNGILRHTAVIPYGGFIITQDIRKGCSILHRHAEQLKVQYGSSLSDTAPSNKVVTLPSVIGNNTKEISFKSLASIIQARMSEILAAVNFEIENSGVAHKLDGGVALTGGGSMLKDLSHLVNYELSMDARVGKPRVSIKESLDKDLTLPIYSTSVGLLLKGLGSGGEQAVTLSPSQAGEAGQETAASRKKGGQFIRKLKNVLSDFFDEQDADM